MCDQVDIFVSSLNFYIFFFSETNGQKAELGANWIHGIDLNPIYKIATQNDLLSTRYEGRSLGAKLMFLRENGEPVNTKIVEEVDWAYGMLMAQCEEFYQDHLPTPVENDSVGRFVESEFEAKIQRYPLENQHLRKMILKQRLLNECIISGAHNMREVALSEVGSFQELPGVHYVIPPGFETIVHILQRDIPKEMIMLNHPVTRIVWDQPEGMVSNSNMHGMCVECSNGRKFYADHVIVTASLGYLKRHSERLFSPPLPDYKLNAINRVAMGTVNKVLLEFAGPVLPPGVFRLEMVWDRESMIDNEDLAQTWFKKIGSFEAVADNVLMGKSPRELMFT